MSYRKQLIFTHTILAAFFLPMGLMYAVTGGLYGLGIKGDYLWACRCRGALG